MMSWLQVLRQYKFFVAGILSFGNRLECFNIDILEIFCERWFKLEMYERGGTRQSHQL
jgi:hypothetical protein